MRRNKGRKFVKRVVAFSIAATLLFGSAMSSFAVEENDNDNGYIGTSEYDGKPQSEISSGVTDNVEAAQDAASEAESAATSAADAADSAQKAKDAAEKAVTDLEEAVNNADTAADNASQIAGENSEYEYKYDENGNVSDYVKKEKAGEESEESEPTSPATVPTPSTPEEPIPTPVIPESEETGVWQDVAELEDTAEEIQNGRDAYQAEAEAAMRDANSTVNESVKAAQEAEGRAKQAAEDAASAAVTVTAASTPGEAAAAQALVDAAAEKAAVAATNADDAYQKALADYEAAKALYEQYIEVDATENSIEDDRIQALQNKIKNTFIDQEITDAESAKAAYEEALQNVTDALAAAESAAESAARAAADASGAADRASDKADSVIDMYVAPAKAAADAAASILANKQNEIEELNKTKKEQESAYNSVVSATTESAITQFNKELAEKKAIFDKAKEEYQKQNLATRTWQKTWNSGKYREMQEAEKAYNNYNSQSAKNDVIATALTNTEEAKVLAATNQAISRATSQLPDLQKAAADTDSVLKDAQAVRDSYIADYNSALAEKEKAAIIDVLRLQVGTTVNDINQTEYEEALSEWANDWVNAINIFEWDKIRDAKKIREYINEKYKQEKFKKLIDKSPLIQWITDPEKLIVAVETAYRIALKQQEEELVTVEAYIAKMDASVAKGAAADSSIAASAARVAAAQAASDQKLREAREKLEEAELTLAKAKASLKKAKEVAESVTVSYVSFDIALKSLQKAEEAVKLAKDARDRAAQEAKNAQNTKEKLDELVNVIRNAGESGNNTTGGETSTNTASAGTSSSSAGKSSSASAAIAAIPLNTLPVPANEPLAGIVQIDPEPIAMTATPVVQGGNPGNNADVNDSSITIIEDEETAQADRVDEKAPASSETTDKTKTIGDEKTALASMEETHSFAWWWIALIVLIVIAAIVGYRYYKTRKVTE